MELLWYTATLPWSTVEWKSCGTLSHRLDAVGGRTPAVHCHTTWGKWAVELLRHIAALRGCRGRWISCGHSALLQFTSRFLRVDNGTPTVHWHTTLEQCVVELLQYAATLPGGSGPWNCYGTLPHWLGAVGNGTSSVDYRTAWGQGAVELLRHIAALRGCCGQWKSCSHSAVDNGTPTVHWRTTLEQCVAELLQETAMLLAGSGPWNCYGTLPHWLGAAGSGTPPAHCRTAWMLWAVEILRSQCLGAVDNGIPTGGQWTPTVHCTTFGHWAVGILWCTNTLPWGSG